MFLLLELLQNNFGRFSAHVRKKKKEEKKNPNERKYNGEFRTTLQSSDVHPLTCKLLLCFWKLSVTERWRTHRLDELF